MLWAMMAIVALLAIIVMARPWLVSRLPSSLRRRSANVAAYRTRLDEIEADLATGFIGADAAESLKAEQANRLLADESLDESKWGGVTGKRRRGVGIALALLPVLIAALWYLQDGSWRTEQEIVTGRAAVNGPADAHVIAMVGKLQDYLKAHPNNPNDWALLGRSRMVLQQYKKAAVAYGQANSHSGNSNPAWLVGEGQALALANGHDLQGQPATLFDAALKIAPDDPRALWYSGLAAAQVGDTRRATQLWQRLARQNIPSDARTALEEEIQKIGGRASTRANSKGGVAAENPDVTLHLDVTMAPSLRSVTNSNAVLFVYAKAASGPSIPLAVQRIADPSFPLKLKLDDSMGVMSSERLSDYSRWVVSALLSRAGNVHPRAGDLEGHTVVSRSSIGRPISLTIDHRVR